MKNDEIIEYLQQHIHTVVIASNDESKNPVTCAIDLMLYENGKLYFLTAKGKDFYNRLMKNPYISLTGIKGDTTMNSISVSLQGTLRNIKQRKLDKIFLENPYMNEIYPTKIARDVLNVFEIFEAQGEYFDLSQKPIFRQRFSIGDMQLKHTGYFVNTNCIGCTLCYENCPQKCIDIAIIPVTILQEHCLHCGKCKDVCPYHAVERK